jgi:hypothetical protein
MAKLSEWMRIMLGEIARKQEEARAAEAERKLREAAAREQQSAVRSAAR